MKRRAMAALLAVILALGYHAWRVRQRVGGTEGVPTRAAGPAAHAPAPDPDGQPRTYESDRDGFSIRYPAGFVIDTGYRYEGSGPGTGISGVRFGIDPALAKGTNLAADSYLSVETVAGPGACDASRFLDARSASRDTVVQGVTYSFASSVGAAAGNRYEEEVFALPGTNPCIAVRYFIHFGVIDNYPPGAVREFDRASLLRTFDAIRGTLVTVSPRA